MVDTCPPIPKRWFRSAQWARGSGFLLSVCVGLWSVWVGMPAALASDTADRPLADAKVPADAPLAISFDNLQAASQAWEKTAWGKLLGGPTFQPLREELEKQNQPAPLNLRPWFGFDWPDLAKLEGPAAFFGMQLPNNRLSVVWIFPEDSEGLTALLAGGQKYWQTHGFVSHKEITAGANLVTFRGKSNQEQRSPTFFSIGKVRGVADQRDAALQLATRWSKSDFASLSNLADYRAACKETANSPPASDIRWWIRPLELWSLLQSKDSSQHKRDWLAITKRQGGEGLRAVGGRVLLPSNTPCDLELLGVALTDRPLTKGARLLDLQPGPAPELPSWLDHQASGIASWRWNFPVAIGAFGQIFDEVNEEGKNGEGLFEELLDGLRDDPEGPQVDLRKEVFAFLGPSLQEITDNRGERTPENPEGARSLMVIQCRDPQRVRKALERFYEGDDLVTQERLAGNPAWTVGPGRSLLVEGESDSLVNIRAVTVTASDVIFASEPTMLRDRLGKKPAAGPDADPQFQAWQKWRKTVEDPQTCFRSLVQASSWSEGSYLRIRSGEFAKQESFSTAVLRFMLLGSEPLANFPYQKMPGWNDLKGSLTALGLIVNQSQPGMNIRVGVFRTSSK